MTKVITTASLAILFLLGFRGFFEIIGFSGSSNLVAFLLSLCLAILTLFKGKFMFPVPFIIIFFVITSYISSSISGTSILQLLSYNKTVIGFFICFMIALINLTDFKSARSIRNLGIAILLFQIPAYFIKLILIGFSEDPAGTISSRDGSATTLISLGGFIFFLTRYITDSKDNRVNLYLAILFIVISQINEKRAIIILTPIFFAYILFQTSEYKKNIISFFFKNIHYIIFLLPIFIYLVAILNPFLNPTGEILGSFDFNFLVNFISSYVYRPDLTVWDYGRLQSFVVVLSFLFNADFVTFLFGGGAGSIIANTGGVTDVIGIRYGARMGFAWVFLQHGLFGILSIILIFRSLFRTLKKYEFNYEIQNEYIALKAYTILLALDFFIYSSVSLFYPVFIFIFLAQYNYILKLCRKNAKT
tara:strand:+ start:16878 stop:18131 length:1254 start_codon:yes stop_codon:yes gene_type:complete